MIELDEAGVSQVLKSQDRQVWIVGHDQKAGHFVHVTGPVQRIPSGFGYVLWKGLKNGYGGDEMKRLGAILEELAIDQARVTAQDVEECSQELLRKASKLLQKPGRTVEALAKDLERAVVTRAIHVTSMPLLSLDQLQDDASREDGSGGPIGELEDWAPVAQILEDADQSILTGYLERVLSMDQLYVYRRILEGKTRSWIAKDRGCTYQAVDALVKHIVGQVERFRANLGPKVSVRHQVPRPMAVLVSQTLAPSEREVFDLWNQGLQYDAIAAKLGLTETAMESRWTRLRCKTVH
jgi:DNA-binding CsgD family transcriptional regulator